MHNHLSKEMDACIRDARGLSVVELLVSIVIISVAITGVISILNNGIFGLRKSESNYNTQNLIDRNLSQIESAADQYVCATISCTVLSAIPAKSAYVDPSNTAAWNSFASRCTTNNSTSGDDLISPLAAWIEENIADPPGLFREISVNGSGSTTDIGFGRVKHLTVQYREGGATGPVLRNSTIIPTVVSYCP